MEIKEKLNDVKNKIVDAINETSKKIKSSEEYAEINNKLHNDEFRTIKEQIIDKIEEYDTIIIHRHVRPDGDAIGSALGLREIIKTNWPDKKVYAVGEKLPEYLKFVGKQDEIDDKEYDGALMIVVDTATSDRISLNKMDLAKEVIKIDHHIVTDNYGSINLVRENYGSCSLVITELCDSMKLNISASAARYLYLAVVTDTGRFKYKEVDGTALRLASILLDKGIDTEEIYSNLYSKDKETYRLQAYVYQNIKYSENGVAYMFMTKRIMKRFKVNVEDASNCVNLMDSIKGSLIWILFIEHDDEIRIRFRSRFVPCVGIANKFYGGGHENAAGGRILNKKEIKKVILEADQVLKEYKANNEDKF